MSTIEKEIIVAFDLYGTLLSTGSIAEELAKHFGGEKATEIAVSWRRFQLEYTWRLNSMGKYIPFNTITHNSLYHALGANKLSLSTRDVDNLMTSYCSLTPFPDVPPALSALASYPTISPLIFSNGPPSMISASLAGSAPLAASSVSKKIVSVDAIKRFKPDPETYKHLAREVGKEGREGEVWLVSSNPFDVVGAVNVGMKAAWVDREGNGWVDRLMGVSGGPTVVVGELGEVARLVMRQVEREAKGDNVVDGEV